VYDFTTTLMEVFMLRLPVFLATSCLLMLGACSSTPRVRYFPPQASLQQLQRLSDGQWQVQLRMQNFSTGAMQFNSLALNVRFQDGEALRLNSNDTLKVGANSAEILNLTLSIPAAQQSLLNERLAKLQSVRYSLQGDVRSIDPNKTYPLAYEGRLNPAPGLDGVFR
jgi:uncharacterized protein YhdP